MPKISLQAEIPEDLSGKRLDQVASILFPEHSRTRLKAWIEAGEVNVSGKILRPKDKVKAHEVIKIEAQISATENWQPQKIQLDVIYTDDDVIVINKPAGLVVHPAVGNPDKTLVNALLYRFPELQNIPRAGVIHRIDKDTAGLLIVARTLQAHTKLVAMLKKHEIEREYEAIVCGVLTSGGTIDAPIGRHPHRRTLMAVVEDGREAVTHYRVIERFLAHTYVRVNLETGRTHQIRVHFSHIDYPLLGDKTYGGRLKLPKGASEKLIQTLHNFPRQALQARRLSFAHPRTGEILDLQAPLAKDMQDLLCVLRAENKV
jgi:23S rRNA pseudouridine1911/1915/1917 synthase